MICAVVLTIFGIIGLGAIVYSTVDVLSAAADALRSIAARNRRP